MTNYPTLEYSYKRAPPGQLKGLVIREILIAVLLISIGFLAVARMQVESMQFSQSSYNKSQAYFMANDIIDRMRANVRGVIDGHYDNKPTTNSYTAPDCSTNACTPEQIASKDLSEWRENLHPSNNARPILPGSNSIIAKGEIVANGDNTFTVNITWAENDAEEALSVSFSAQGNDGL